VVDESIENGSWFVFSGKRMLVLCVLKKLIKLPDLFGYHEVNRNKEGILYYI
jgi:hypothetical protein